MRVNWFFFSIQMVGICLVSLWMGVATVAQAEPLTSHETNGTIRFHGTYESENKPHPNPPDGGKPSLVPEAVSKPVSGTLPQLGQLLKQQWLWLVFVLIGFCYLHWKKREWKTAES